MYAGPDQTLCKLIPADSNTEVRQHGSSTVGTHYCLSPNAAIEQAWSLTIAAHPAQPLAAVHTEMRVLCSKPPCLLLCAGHDARIKKTSVVKFEQAW